MQISITITCDSTEEAQLVLHRLAIKDGESLVKDDDVFVPDEPFGDWLRAERIWRGLTQKKLSHMSGVSRPHIVNLEKGNSSKPRLETMYKLQQALERA